MTAATAAAAQAEPSAAAAISVRELTVRFDGDALASGITALESVGFEVPEGGFVTMLGPSGCGKSTLLRAIADLVPIAGGGISVFGRTPEQARRPATSPSCSRTRRCCPGAAPSTTSACRSRSAGRRDTSSSTRSRRRCWRWSG